MNQPPGGTRGHPVQPLHERIIKFSKAPEAPNGILCNGVLLWLEANRHTTPRDIVFRAASAKYDDSEVAEAKEDIFSFSAMLSEEFSQFIGQYPIQKKDSKKASAKKEKELNDIMDVMEKISEIEMMPVIVATTQMMQRNPPMMLETENLQKICSLIL